MLGAAVALVAAMVSVSASLYGLFSSSNKKKDEKPKVILEADGKEIEISPQDLAMLKRKGMVREREVEHHSGPAAATR
jgi:hypothetical protein